MSESPTNNEEHLSEENVRTESTTGLFSYIRLGRPRTSDPTSSPTTATPTGQYVWDFLHWGLTSPYGLEQFSRITPQGTEIVPFSNMDQGKLFVRVSVQDLATLQLAYRRGLGALQKSQSKADQLQAENHRLQSMMKGWSVKTTELTTETITLRQEITLLKHKLRSPNLGEYEYREFITFLCRSVCQMFENNAVNTYSTGPTFNYLLKLIFSLPLKIQEKLSSFCPKFKKLIHSRSKEFLSKMQCNDARVTIQSILKMLPVEGEYKVIEDIVQDFNKRQEISSSLSSSQDVMASSTKSLPESKVNDNSGDSSEPGKRIQVSLELSAEENPSYDSKSQEESTKPAIPPRNYSIEDIIGSTNELHRCRGREHLNNLNKTTSSEEVKGAAALDRLDKLVINNNSIRPKSISSEGGDKSKTGVASSKEPVYAEVMISNKPQKVSSEERESKSKSHNSSIGTPLAQSTPFGTWSTLVSPKHQINPNNGRKRKKRRRKISRWNLAARLCSSARSNTISDSDSMESSIYHQTTMTPINVRRHHGLPPNKLSKGYKWFFKSKK